jgi:hypothetical protein
MPRRQNKINTLEAALVASLKSLFGSYGDGKILRENVQDIFKSKPTAECYA